MTIASQVPIADNVARRVRRVQEITIVWMSMEAPVTLFAASHWQVQLQGLGVHFCGLYIHSPAVPCRQIWC